jgi:hypothetical protein
VEEGEIGKYLENVNKGFCGVGGSGDRNLGEGRKIILGENYFLFLFPNFTKK